MSLSGILEFFYVILAVIILFGAAVFVHEFGHFWVALKCGMKVEEFAIGFGRKIKSWKRNGIEYSVRWIPAGGFVRLPQMITSEALEGSSQEPCPPAAPWKRMLTAFAGPGMNIVFAFVIACILFFTGIPVLDSPSVIGYVNEKSEEAQAGIKEGDVIVAFNGKQIRSWDTLLEACLLCTKQEAEVVTMRQIADDDGHLLSTTYATNTLKLSTRPELAGTMFEKWKFLNLEPKDHPVAIDVIADGPADQAGMQNNDLIKSFEGIPVASTQRLIALIQQKAGQTCEMVVERTDADGNTKEQTLHVTPSDVNGQGKIMVHLGNKSKQVLIVQKPGPLPWIKVKQVIDKNVDTFNALFHPKQSGVGVKDLSGPIGILGMLGGYVKTDYRLALDFMILLNVGLAILNLLPIPVLDGGHILISGIEWLTGKAINIKVLEWVTTAFAILLIGFMLYVTFRDVQRFSLYKSMYQQEVQIESAEQPTDSAPAEGTAEP